MVLGLYVIGLATSMSLMEFGSALLFLYVICSKARKNLSLTLPLAKRLLLFSLIVIFGILMGESTLHEKIYDLGRVRFLLLYFVLYAVLITEVSKTYWLNILRFITSLVGIYGFIQHFVAIDLFRPEGKKVLLYALQEEKIGPLVVGTFNHHLTFSNSYLFFACLFFSMGLDRPKKFSYDLGLGAFLFLLVFWTQSRIAWVAIPFCLLFLSYAHFGRKAFLRTVIGIGVLLFGLYGTSVSFQDRLSKTFQVNDQRSFVPRQNLWRAQIEMWKEKPFLGVGWNNNERRSKVYIDRLFPGQSSPFYGHAHSLFLQILATTGVLGSIAFFSLWVGLFQMGYRTMSSVEGRGRAIMIGVVASFIGFCIQGLTQWNFGDAEVVHTVIFFWALTASLYSTRNQNFQESY